MALDSNTKVARLQKVLDALAELSTDESVEVLNLVCVTLNLPPYGPPQRPCRPQTIGGGGR